MQPAYRFSTNDFWLHRKENKFPVMASVFSLADKWACWTISEYFMKTVHMQNVQKHMNEICEKPSV